MQEFIHSPPVGEARETICFRRALYFIELQVFVVPHTKPRNDVLQVSAGAGFGYQIVNALLYEVASAVGILAQRAEHRHIGTVHLRRLDKCRHRVVILAWITERNRIGDQDIEPPGWRVLS